MVFMTPILKDLTRDISSDTIVTMTIFMFAINLLFHDYDGGHEHGFHDAISVNAAMCASVLLASRLNTHFTVAVLMFLAIVLFALFPMYRRNLGRKSPNNDILLALGLFSFSCFLIETDYRLFYVGVTLSVQFICPWILVNLQKYKKYAFLIM
jgi:phosphatidylinositol glycan class C protein